jgi:hypothetical protein
MSIKINYKEDNRPVESIVVEQPSKTYDILIQTDVTNKNRLFLTDRIARVFVHKECIDALIEALELAKEKL